MGSRVLVGTGTGVHLIQLPDGSTSPVGLLKQFVTHVAVRGEHLLAACPVFGPIHEKHYGVRKEDQQAAGGLWHINLASPSSLKAKQVWRGDARSCNVGPGDVPKLYVGTEPADVLSSEDLGASWKGTDSFKALASRPQWTFPGPPHIPHTLSIELAELNGKQLVIGGVEVGGLVVSEDEGSSWEELGVGQICPDVHRCRADPFDQSRWLAVCGGGNAAVGTEDLTPIPGGLWESKDAGKQWARVETMPKQWYLTGLAFNPFKQGEIIVAAADSPPFHGVYLYFTSDGGKTWVEIADRVFEGREKGDQTPVPYFVREGVLIGAENGAILFAEQATSAGWKVLGHVPSRVTCFAEDGRSPSSTMH
jgi:hypothetical protein